MPVGGIGLCPVRRRSEVKEGRVFRVCGQGAPDPSGARAGGGEAGVRSLPRICAFP